MDWLAGFRKKGKWFGKKDTAPIKEITHWCDACSTPIDPDGVRYHCLDCKDYDLCGECVGVMPVAANTKGHTSDHIVVADTFSASEREEKLIACPNLAATFLLVFDMYKDRPCLGVPIKPAADAPPIDVLWYKYSTMKTFSSAVSMGIRELRGEGDEGFVGMCGENCVEWFATDFACIYAGLPSVPIHFTLDVETTALILNSTSISTVVVDMNYASKYIEAAPLCPHLKHIVVICPFDTHDSVYANPAESGLCEGCDDGLNALREQAAAVTTSEPLTIVPFCSIYLNGLSVLESDSCPDLVVPFAEDPANLYTIIHTSGSSGQPKGVVYDINAWNCNLARRVNLPEPLIEVCFLPLAHSSSRRNTHLAVCNGGRVTMHRDTIDTVFETFAVGRPTIISSVPRLWTSIYDDYQAKLEVVRNELIAAANDLASMSPELREVAMASIEANAEEAALDQVRGVLGGNQYLLVAGGAPTPPAVLAFLRRCFRCGVGNGYGATEVGGISGNGNMRRNCNFKLEDVPELGYLSTDKPWPRGQLLVQTPGICAGYWKNDEENEKKFVTDEEGRWFRTGDVVELYKENGQEKTRIIDRVGNVRKTVHGEFVAPSRIEGILLASPIAKQIYVHVCPYTSFLLAVVVVNFDILVSRVTSLPNSPFSTAEEVADAIHNSSPVVTQIVLDEFGSLGRAGELQSHEIVRGVLLTTERFTAENGMLTPTNKLNRTGISRFYAKELEELETKVGGGDATLELTELLGGVVSTAGGVGPDAKDLSDVGLAELGVDSLASVRLARTIEEQYGVKIPVRFLFSNPTVAQLAAYIRGETEVESTTRTQLSHLLAEAYLPEGVSVGCETGAVVAMPAADDATATVLLTGATGFLGAFLLAELLSSTQWRVVCVARSSKARDPGSCASCLAANLAGDFDSVSTPNAVVQRRRWCQSWSSGGLSRVCRRTQARARLCSLLRPVAGRVR